MKSEQTTSRNQNEDDPRLINSYKRSKTEEVISLINSYKRSKTEDDHSLVADQESKRQAVEGKQTTTVKVQENEDDPPLTADHDNNA